MTTKATTTTALAWGIFWVLAIAMVWWAACGPTVTRGEAWYDSGDTLSVHMAALDSSGAVFLPDSTRIIFVRNGTRKDSIGYGGTLATGMTAKGGGWLSGIFVIPASWNPPYDLVLEGRFWGDGFSEDVALVEPRRVRVLDTVPYVTELVEAFNESLTYVAYANELIEPFNDSISYVTEVGTTYLLDEAFPTTMAAAGGWIDSSLVTVTARALDEAFPTSMTTTGGYLDSVGVAVLLREEWPTQIDSVGIALLLDEAFPTTMASAGGWTDSTLVAVELREEIAGGAGGNPTGGYVDSVGVAVILREEITASVAAVDSLTPNALGDLWAGIASGTAAIIDSSDCTNCGVYAGGVGVTGAPVYITTGSTFSSMSQVIGFTWSVGGYWRVRIPTVPSVNDTVYVWAYQSNRYTPAGIQIVIAE